MTAARVLDVDVAVDAPGVVAGFIVARGCTNGPAPAGLDDEVAAAIAAAATRDDVEASRQGVRALLRFGTYKPTGRGKPASEYLHQAAVEGRFPRIGALVDAGNLASLRSLLPVSVLDLDRAAATRFVVRRGRAGERYVFNAGGQDIDVADLLLVAALPDDRPCGSAVKDSLGTKLVETSKDVLCVVYGWDETAVTTTTNVLAASLRRFVNPAAIETSVLTD